MYEAMRALFSQLEARSPAALAGLLQERLSLRFKCTDPAAEITLDGHKRPVQISYGPAAGRPDLDLEMPADVLHNILLDELSMKKAMGSGRIRVHGPAWKLKVMIDIVKAGRTIYPAIARRYAAA